MFELERVGGKVAMIKKQVPLDVSLGTCVFRKLLKEKIIDEGQFRMAVEELRRMYDKGATHFE